MKFVDIVRWPFRMILWVITPSFWRSLVFGQIRVAVYLSSGQTVKIQVKTWKTTLDAGRKSYEATGFTDQFSFDPASVMAWREVRWW